MIVHVEFDADADLPEIAQALRDPCLLLRPTYRGQQKRGENGNDGDDH